MYATKQDMIDRYSERELIELTDRAEPYTDAIVDTVLDKALADAGIEIDSYIARKYDLPLASTPPMLNRHACTIAWYILHRGRHPDEVRDQYKDALSWLKDVADGRVELDVAGSRPDSAPADARVEGPDKTFSRDTLEGF